MAIDINLLTAGISTEAKQDTQITALGALATQTTSAAILAKLSADPSTATKQDTGNTSLATIATNTGTIATNTPTVGQKTSANSSPVVLPSDQLVPVVGDVADNAVQVNTKPVYVGAKAVNLGAYTPGYTANDAAGAAIDITNGALAVNQCNLKLAEDTVGAILGATSTNANAKSKFRSLTQSTTGQMVKSSSGNLYTINIINLVATVTYLKFYDKATAASNADTPIWTVAVPATVGASVTQIFNLPINFASGISIRVTSDSADNGNTPAGTLPILELEYA